MLRIDRLSARYGEMVALSNVSIEVRAGEVVALVGSNGAGKSTLLAAISGLLRSVSGSVALEGREILGSPAHAVVEAGVIHVPEGRHLFPFMTVEENLRMGAFSRSARPGRAGREAQMLELLPRLAERRRQLAGTLSGGEQQMCAIARGLMGQPRLLMLDEPTLGLSPIMTSEIIKLIGAIRERGTTVLIVEQQVAAALQLADRAYVLERGQVTLTGTGSELLNNEDLRRAYMGI